MRKQIIVVVITLVASAVAVTPSGAQSPTQGSECGAGFLQDYFPCVRAVQGDLNCGDALVEDLGSAIRIDGGDPYGFDRDGDGYGCDGNGDRPAALPPPILCEGQVATIVGTEGDDVLVGTDGNDVIAGLGGNDVLRGLDGNDVLCGDNGRDKIFGGPGNDLLAGGKKNDILKGDQGKDRLFGQAGNDRLFGGGGGDTLSGGSGLRDVLDGKGGSDTCGDPQGATRLLNCER